MTGTAAKARRRREQSAFSSDDGHTTPKSCPELEARNLTSELDDASTGRLNAVLGCVRARMFVFTGPPETRPLQPFHGPEGGQPTPAAAGGGASMAGAPSILDISLQVQEEMYNYTRRFSPLCSRFTPVIL